jgi:hypothetical protein
VPQRQNFALQGLARRPRRQKCLDASCSSKSAHLSSYMRRTARASLLTRSTPRCSARLARRVCARRPRGLVSDPRCLWPPRPSGVVETVSGGRARRARPARRARRTRRAQHLRRRHARDAARGRRRPDHRARPARKPSPEPSRGAPTPPDTGSARPHRRPCTARTGPVRRAPACAFGARRRSSRGPGSGSAPRRPARPAGSSSTTKCASPASGWAPPALPRRCRGASPTLRYPFAARRAHRRTGLRDAACARTAV